MLLHLLTEVERELRAHDRHSAAVAVRRAASLVADDIEAKQAQAPRQQLLM
jgi:hypothetical protein